MLCYAMLCYAMLCCAMLCYAMLCYAMLCYAMLCYAMLCYAMLCYAMLCYAMLRYTLLYYTVLYYIILSHTILYYILRYIMDFLWSSSGHPAGSRCYPLLKTLGRTASVRIQLPPLAVLSQLVSRGKRSPSPEHDQILGVLEGRMVCLGKAI